MINIELSFVTDLMYYVIVLCLYMYYCIFSASLSQNHNIISHNPC